MWSISGVKALGNRAYQRDYWKTLLMALLAVVCFGGSAMKATLSLPRDIDWNNFGGSFYYQAHALMARWESLFGFLAGVTAFSGLFSIAVKIFALNPLLLGTQRYMLLHTEGPASLSELGFGFQGNYLGKVKTLFLRNLYIFLWSLLFVVPGIVKAYSYRLVPYILSEHPEMDTREVLETSAQLMQGHKGHAFWLDLSFLGWYLLSAVTVGIVGVFVVNPYNQMTNAYLFKAIAYPGSHSEEEPYRSPYAQKG
ncbi:MAG: DUF975 family protein [Oscillospiraceae bacterium]|nr:DUF975 family protein [Oscillospiraceae bacterium]